MAITTLSDVPNSALPSFSVLGLCLALKDQRSLRIVPAVSTLLGGGMSNHVDSSSEDIRVPTLVFATVHMG